jgi:hypothetical protein
MRTILVCVLMSFGLAACADKAWPPWLPAPVTDEPEARAIMSSGEPASPYLLQPYRPQRPWTWPATPEPPAVAQPAKSQFDPNRVARKLEEGAASSPGTGTTVDKVRQSR